MPYDVDLNGVAMIKAILGKLAHATGLTYDKHQNFRFKRSNRAKNNLRERFFTFFSSNFVFNQNVVCALVERQALPIFTTSTSALSVGRLVLKGETYSVF